MSALLLALTLPFLVGGHPSPTDSIDAYVQSEMRRRHLPGLAVAVIRHGRIIKARGYGLANVELAAPATDSTVYQIASITKLFTATAVMMLMEQGKLAVDDPIAKSVPDLPVAWAAITVRQLLTHRSGLKDFTDLPAYQSSRSQPRSPRDVIALVATEPLDFPPGSKFSYSNTGYILLGMLIEQLGGQSYGEFLRTHIFEPLGMRHTLVNDLNEIVPGRAAGYEWRGPTLRNADIVSPRTSFAAGMVASSVRDLAIWDLAFFTGKLLEPAALREMTASGAPLGWEEQVVNGHRALVHAGDILGFSTQLEHFVDDSLTVIVLTNAMGPTVGSRKIARGISALLVPALAIKREPAIRDPNPRATDRYRAILQHAFIDGIVDQDLFTEQMKQRTSPAQLEDSKRFHALFGRLTALELLSRRETVDGVELWYRAIFEGETARALVKLTPDGRIAGLALQSEPPY